MTSKQSQVIKMIQNLINLGNICESKNEYKNAIDNYYKVLQLNPNNYEILYKIGVCYHNMGNIKMAVNCFVNVSKNIPKNHELYLNIGLCYKNIKEYNLSIEYYLKAVQLKHNDEVYHALGDLYFYIKDYDNSIKYYDKIKNKTNIIEYNKCFPYLAKKEYKKGFELYENRLYNNYCHQTKQNSRVEIPNVEFWNGIDKCNKLLVVYEQGLGDNILFYRFIIQLSELYPDMEIDYFCKDTISHLFKEFPNIKIIDNVIIHLYKYKLYIMSLPKVLNISHADDIKQNTYDYIKINNDKLLYWKDKLYIKKFKIGVVCSGLLSSFIDKNIPIEHINELSKLNDNIEIIYLDKSNNDIDKDVPFEDTVAILKNIDLFITTDTVSVHLAGALNIKTWLLLGYGSDWRWFNDDKCIWFNSVEIIRMTENKPLYNILPIVKKKLLDLKVFI